MKGPLRSDEPLALKQAQTVLKRRERDLEAQGARSRKLKEAKKLARQEVKVKGPITLDSLVKKAIRTKIDRRRALRTSKFVRTKQARKPNEVGVVLVIRNTEKHKAGETGKILKSFRLNRYYSGCFLRNTQENLIKLKRIETFVLWGFPSADLLRRVLKTQGRVQQEDEKTVKSETSDPKGPQLLNNLVVEEVFGELGLLSVEDVVDQLFRGGEHLEAVTSKLAPFQFESLRKAEGINPDIRRGYQATFETLAEKLV